MAEKPFPLSAEQIVRGLGLMLWELKGTVPAGGPDAAKRSLDATTLRLAQAMGVVLANEREVVAPDRVRTVLRDCPPLSTSEPFPARALPRQSQPLGGCDEG